MGGGEDTGPREGRDSRDGSRGQRHKTLPHVCHLPPRSMVPPVRSEKDGQDGFLSAHEGNT